MKLSNAERTHFRKIGHNLKPVVTVAGNGLSDTVVLEIDRALTDHELIKLKLAVGDRETRKTMTVEICARLRCDVAQSVGQVLLVIRRTDKPNPKLSNLLRPLN